MSHSFRPALTLTIKSSGAITANRFVTAAGAQAGADANAIGVALAAASGANEYVPVVSLGTASVEAGGVISAGATVKSDSQGRAVTWATSGAKIGVALEASGGAGEVIEVFLVPNAA
jgi:hypothetical protein